MPRKTHLVILLVLLGVVVAQAEPKLIVTETEFNYGKVAQQSELSHGFWLKSVGDDTVRILEVFPGCGCTQIPLPRCIYFSAKRIIFSMIIHSYFTCLTNNDGACIDVTRLSLNIRHIIAKIIVS